VVMLQRRWLMLY